MGNDRVKLSMGGGRDEWTEVMFNTVFGGRFGKVPFRTPRCYFCDMSRRTTNFTMIFEMLPCLPLGDTLGDTDFQPGQLYNVPCRLREWVLPKSGVELYF